MELNPVVLKFGGSSVAEVDHWDTIVSQCENQLTRNNKPILVLSALKNISNRLEALLHQAKKGEHHDVIGGIIDKHIQFASSLGLDLSRELNPYSASLRQHCNEIFAEQVIKPSIHAEVLAIGELLSTCIGAAFLSHKGFSVKWVDARGFLIAKPQLDEWHHFTSNYCGYDFEAELCQVFWPKGQDENHIIVTQGFIAADTDGRTVLLGREGSDTSAAYIASLTGAKELEIWTDVTGVFTSNPREVTKAKPIPKLSYHQAFLMANSGAKVLHPRVLEPAEKSSCAVCVKSTWHPEHPGSLISIQSVQQKKLLAVVVEYPVIHLASNKNLQHTHSLTHLQKLGYECLQSCQNEHQYHYWLKYLNSDQPELSTSGLKQVLGDCLISINEQGYLLSLIGASKESTWQVDTKVQMKALLNNEDIIVFSNQSPDYLGCYVSTPVEFKRVNEVHDALCL